MKTNLFQKTLAFVVAIFLNTNILFAQVEKLDSPTPKVGTLFEFVVIILSIVIKIGIPVATIFLIYAGYLFLTAQGDTKKIALARWTFFWTVIGAAVLLGAVLLARVIHNTITIVAS